MGSFYHGQVLLHLLFLCCSLWAEKSSGSPARLGAPSLVFQEYCKESPSCWSSSCSFLLWLCPGACVDSSPRGHCFVGAQGTCWDWSVIEWLGLLFSRWHCGGTSMVLECRAPHFGCLCQCLVLLLLRASHIHCSSSSVVFTVWWCPCAEALPLILLIS